MLLFDIFITFGYLSSLVQCAYQTFESSTFTAKLDTSSQTLASLSPKSLPSFDFSPFDVISSRSANGNYHVGDVTLRYRNVGATAWTNINSATARAAVKASAISGTNFAASDLTPTIPAGSPFNITRAWGFETGDLTLKVTLLNNQASDIEIGAFGFPIEFNTIFTARTSVDTQAKCSLIDPNIGLDGGFLRVTPLSGTGPALVITPINAPFEAWRFLTENTGTSLAYQSQTFEGFYSWETFTKAYAENEWKSTVPWNPPTSKILASKQSITLGLKFSLADEIATIGNAVIAAKTPLAVGTPGYIIPQDLQATLKLYYNSSVSSISAVPTGAFTFKSTTSNQYTLTPSSSAWGRLRVMVNYTDGKSQSIHYYVTKSAPKTISDLGNFLTTSQYFNDTSDPFGRTPSIISYDRSVNKMVTQDPRVWIAGLSDEGGAGSWLAAAMKQAAQPNAAEVTKLEDFIHKVLWKTLQNSDYSVRKSVFFYQPGQVTYTYNSSLSWGNWWSWNKANAFATDRAYDYVHVAAAYWAIYRVARGYPSLVKQADWNWYLTQAYKTVSFCISTNVGYSQVGLMGETVFGYLLLDLQRENLTTDAKNLEQLMRTRAARWNSEAVPYGSEMAWDSTGQEGVYYWSKHFNFTTTVVKTIHSILGFTPGAVSHWAWQGNSRRYWDNIYGGKLMRYERQGHHYGSALNALPLLDYFQANPSMTYLLRVGYGGMNGPLSNIDQEGFASASFHTWPDTLAFDAYSGDYGPGFLGLVLGAGTYIIEEYGETVVFGGNLSQDGDALVVELRDAVRRRVYLGKYGIELTVDAGAIEKVRVVSNQVIVSLAASVESIAGEPKANSSILWVESKVSGARSFQVGDGLKKVRGGSQVDLSGGSVDVNITFA
ncbi:hypothetical protein HYALB_00011055 [Hymenoscyphus albidus]|uniref:Glycoside hydrolase family 43 protein n=1 Tax=Hymenoscyphus albidus TaxID=595503 RepID=A0A9N9LTD3_9HELO|nr:hypothetical protein HYALB_00011055 [Hymenoscyphus albidus]